MFFFFFHSDKKQILDHRDKFITFCQNIRQTQICSIDIDFPDESHRTSIYNKNNVISSFVISSTQSEGVVLA